MVNIVPHHMEGGIAAVEPLADSSHFSIDDATVAVPRHETIDGGIEKRKEPPRHWEERPIAEMNQLHHSRDIAQVNKRIGIKEFPQFCISQSVAVFECRVDANDPTFQCPILLIKYSIGISNDGNN